MPKKQPLTSMDPLLNLFKRRGILFNSAEIYNGAGGLLDLGPLGVELMRNLKNAWWRHFVLARPDMVGVDAAILTPHAVLHASGHTTSFTDPLTECANCHIRLRSDHYLEEDDLHIWMERWMGERAKIRGLKQKSAESVKAKADEENALEAAKLVFDWHEDAAMRKPTLSHLDLVCPNPDCGKQAFTEPKLFNMMFETYLGPIKDTGSTVYLRPETAPGIFTNFKNILDTYHKKLPFGIAQIGKAFRNEITIGNSLFRVREFEQAEIEYFVKPEDAPAAFEQWLQNCDDFLTKTLQINAANLRRYEHPKEKLSHYSNRTVDFEYNYPGAGWGELWGIADRTNFDLSVHQEASKKDLTYFDEVTRERFLPYVVEPSVGMGRLLLTLLVDSYQEYPQGRTEEEGGEAETVLHLPAAISPVLVAVLPLMKKDGLAEKAQEVLQVVQSKYPDRLSVYEDSGAIGRRYRKQDEIGTPYCVTIDYQTLQDETVTVRDRDTMEQKRMKIQDLSF